LSEQQSSMRFWLAIIGALVATAVLAGAWPAIINTFRGGGSTVSTPGMGIPVLQVPIPPALIPTLEGIIPITDGALALNGLLAVLILTVIIIGGVAVMGAGLAFAFRFIDNLTNQEKESEAYQQKQAALQKQEQERLKAAKEGRDPTPKPEHKMPRWSRLANVLIFWMFLILAGMTFNRTFYPTGEILLQPGDTFYGLLALIGQAPVLDTALLFIWLPSLLLLPFAIWWIQPQRIAATDETDYGAIPWDFLAVVFTGLVVVGLGIAYMVYLAVPG
jgi:hypothetical protein